MFFIIGAPADQSLSKAYDRALEFISEARQHPRVITEDQFDAAADELARQIIEHPPETSASR